MKNLIRLTFITIGTGLLLQSCLKSNKTSQEETLDSLSGDETVSLDTNANSNLYAQIDTFFVVNEDEYSVRVEQFDVTEIASSQGNPQAKPTYTFALKIFNLNNQLVFRDSLHLNTWGYKGKIKPVDSYEMTLPVLSLENNEIISAFLIYEYESNDAIRGFMSFDFKTGAVRYFWKEASLEN